MAGHMLAQVQQALQQIENDLANPNLSGSERITLLEERHELQGQVAVIQHDQAQERQGQSTRRWVTCMVLMQFLTFFLGLVPIVPGPWANAHLSVASATAPVYISIVIFFLSYHFPERHSRIFACLGVLVQLISFGFSIAATASGSSWLNVAAALAAALGGGITLEFVRRGASVVPV